MPFVKMSAEEYHKDSAVSNSFLTAFMRSPAFAMQQRVDPKPPSAAQILGSALHAAVLEPEAYKQQYVTLDVNRRTKAGKEEVAKAEEAGQIVLDPDNDTLVEGMRRAILAHPKAKRLIEQATAFEESAFWEWRGVPCKSRKDIRTPTTIVDLKSTSDLERFSPWHIKSFGYHRQGAWYIDGDKELGVATDFFFFIVVWNTPPHEVALYQLTDESVRAGREQIYELFDRLIECREKNAWPSAITETRVAELPRAELRQIFGEDYHG